jgi:hypothetical protein
VAQGFDDLDVDWVLHPAGPDTVLVELSMNGRGRDSGVPVRLRIGQLWTCRQGVPQRMVLFTDYEKARRAAGLAG